MAILPFVVLSEQCYEVLFFSEPVNRLVYQILLKSPTHLTGWIRPCVDMSAHFTFYKVCHLKSAKRNLQRKNHLKYTLL